MVEEKLSQEDLDKKEFGDWYSREAPKFKTNNPYALMELAWIESKEALRKMALALGETIKTANENFASATARISELESDLKVQTARREDLQVRVTEAQQKMDGLIRENSELMGQLQRRNRGK